MALSGVPYRAQRSFADLNLFAIECAAEDLVPRKCEVL